VLFEPLPVLALLLRLLVLLLPPLLDALFLAVELRAPLEEALEVAEDDRRRGVFFSSPIRGRFDTRSPAFSLAPSNTFPAASATFDPALPIASPASPAKSPTLSTTFPTTSGNPPDLLLDLRLDDLDDCAIAIALHRKILAAAYDK
jgi:hypothetical protein